MSYLKADLARLFFHRLTLSSSPRRTALCLPCYYSSRYETLDTGVNLVLPAQDRLGIVPDQSIKVVILVSILLTGKQIIPIPAYQFDGPFMPVHFYDAAIKVLLLSSHNS